VDSRAKQHPWENSWRLFSGTNKGTGVLVEEREALAQKRKASHSRDARKQDAPQRRFIRRVAPPRWTNAAEMMAHAQSRIRTAEGLRWSRQTATS
jgi:hypothetical protein